MVLNPSHGRHNGPGSDVQLREGRRSPYAACLGPGNHREASYKAYPCRLDDSTHKASGQVGALAPACRALFAGLGATPTVTVAASRPGRADLSTSTTGAKLVQRVSCRTWRDSQPLWGWTHRRKQCLRALCRFSEGFAVRARCAQQKTSEVAQTSEVIKPAACSL
jgi:hypothetical protein